ncbi:MAG: ATP-NAD kinase [Euryarchaeota archaeon]|jgi:predicted polyphosphate/ATP-dependent NAD kinase|nr:ATP-NAD kinase [Euryarchaeota archaeon]
MFRIGLVVNPDAGLGGRLGLKGSDGLALKARAEGAEDRAGPRARSAMALLENALTKYGATVLISEGRMGSEWLDSESDINTIVVHESSGTTSHEDTRELVKILVNQGVDLILYAGGDGTTRDLIQTLEENESSTIPIVGIPCGVKMYSGCFASSPKAASEVVEAWMGGDLLVASTEVLDLDEEIYRDGGWSVRLYAEAMTPSSPRWMQGAKEMVESASEDEVIEGIAEHVRDVLMSPERLVIWGSGGTLRRIGEIVGLSPTLLGMDASLGNNQVGTDLSERGLIELLDSHRGEVTILLSPMGGQGFLIGRGNLQLSPEVLRKAKPSSVLGICTPSKLLTIRSLRIETGDDELDDIFREMKYLKALQGYRTTRILPVSVD